MSMISLVPNRITKKYLDKTNFSSKIESLYLILFVFTLLSGSVLFYFLLYPLIDSPGILFFAGLIFLCLLYGVYLLIVIVLFEFIIFRRIKEIEDMLPDFLQEVSVNLKAGLSFDKSLFNAVKPEYGVLSDEMAGVAQEVMISEDTEDALTIFSKKYDSLLLQESMDMMIVGMRSGGNITDLIDKIVKNVKEASYLRKELVASVTGYVIFISMTALIIAPLLFALSFHLMEIMQGLGEKITFSDSLGTGLPTFSFKNIDSNDFITFSKISLIIIASISSIIIADLREGSLKAAIKYIVIYVPITYIAYTMLLNFLSVLFSFFLKNQKPNRSKGRSMFLKV